MIKYFVTGKNGAVSFDSAIDALSSFSTMLNRIEFDTVHHKQSPTHSYIMLGYVRDDDPPVVIKEAVWNYSKETYYVVDKNDANES